MDDSPTRSPSPVGHRVARQFRAVVAAQYGWVATHGGEAIQFVDEDVGSDRSVDQPAEAFAGVFVDDRDDLDGAAVGGGVELEVHRPDLVRCISLRPVGCRARAEAFASATLRHPTGPLRAQALDHLVVDVPALTAGIVIRGPEPTPGMVLRVGPQPPPQLGIRSATVVLTGSRRCVVRFCPVTRQANR